MPGAKEYITFANRMIIRFFFEQMEKFTEKKRAIFESTLELVTEKGFHGCAMSSIAKTADVGAGTIYHHFESKEQLICELYTYITDKIISATFAGDEEQLPFKERFFRLWMNLYHFYIKHPAYPKFFQQFVNSPYYPYRDKEGHDYFLELLFAFHAQGIEQGVLQSVNPEILGLLTHSNIITTAKIQGFGKIPLGQEELEQISGILWGGMAVTA